MHIICFICTIIQIICIFNLYFTFSIKNDIILSNKWNGVMLRVLSKIKSISHIVLVAVVTASFVVVANKACSTLSNFNNVASNFNNVATKVEKVFGNKDIEKFISNANIAASNANIALENIKNFTDEKNWKDLIYKLQDLISKLDDNDIQLIKESIANINAITTNGKKFTDENIQTLSNIIAILEKRLSQKFLGMFGNDTITDEKKNVTRRPTENNGNLWAFCRWFLGC